jgi:hypothetical protein
MQILRPPAMSAQIFHKNIGHAEFQPVRASLITGSTIASQ